MGGHGSSTKGRVVNQLRGSRPWGMVAKGKGQRWPGNTYRWLLSWLWSELANAADAECGNDVMRGQRAHVSQEGLSNTSMAQVATSRAPEGETPVYK
eukprot:jgi/Mesvir1/5425/Mv25561-RA.1